MSHSRAYRNTGRPYFDYAQSYRRDMRERVDKLRREQEDRRKKYEERIAEVNRKYDEQQRVLYARRARILERRLQSQQRIGKSHGPVGPPPRMKISDLLTGTGWVPGAGGPN